MRVVLGWRACTYRQRSRAAAATVHGLAPEGRSPTGPSLRVCAAGSQWARTPSSWIWRSSPLRVRGRRGRGLAQGAHRSATRVRQPVQRPRPGWPIARQVRRRPASAVLGAGACARPALVRTSQLGARAVTLAESASSGGPPTASEAL